MDGLVIPPPPGPLHRQVTTDLLARIAGGEFAPGSMIPTEDALCRMYGVSRITIRRAVAALVERGLVTRRRGVGSSVTGRPRATREMHLVGMLDETMPAEHRILRDERLVADPSVAAALDLPPGALVRHIASLVHRDGAPFTVADTYTADASDLGVGVGDYQPGVPAAIAQSRRLGRPIVRAAQVLDAVAADSALAAALGIPPETPVMRASRTYYAAGDAPVQHLVVRYHPDRYRFVVDLVAPGGAAPAHNQEELP